MSYGITPWRDGEMKWKLEFTLFPGFVDYFKVKQIFKEKVRHINNRTYKHWCQAVRRIIAKSSFFSVCYYVCV